MPQPETAPPQRPRISRAEWAVILVLAAVNFTHVVDFVIVMPLGGQLMRELDVDAGQFSRVVSVYGIAAAVTGVLAAGLLDRFDRKRMLLTNFAGCTVATLLCGVAWDYPTLLIARTLAGAFGGLTGAAIMATVGDVFEDARRGTATGAVMSAFAVGSIVGLPTGLWLAGRFGWGAPFLALGGLGLAVLAVAAVVLPPGRLRPTADGASPLVRMARVAAHPPHARALAFMGLVIFAAFVMIPFLGPFFEQNLGHVGRLPAIYMTAGVCTLVSMNVVGRLSDRLGKRLMFRVMASFTVVMILVVTHLPPVPLWAAAGVAALFMVGGSGRMVPAQALVIGCVRPADRGAFLSLNSAVQSAALGSASAVGGLLVTKAPDGTLVGYPTAGLVAAGLTGLTLLMVRYIRPAELPAPAPAPEPAAV